MDNKYTVQGLGVSSGRAIGRIQTNESNKNNNQPCILIVEELTRGVVTTLQDNVVGVLSIKGSVGSHGAGILRELRIPCVLRIPELFQVFQENEIVEIIGEQGKVIKLEKSFQQIIQKVDTKVEIKIQDGEICYRPNRIYQTLRFSIMKEAWENSPKFLFNSPKCQLELRRGIIYVKGAPDLESICDMVIRNPDWYISMAKKRSTEIQEIKNELRSIYKFCELKEWKISVSEAVDHLKICIRLYQKLLYYIFMTQFISDKLTEKLLTMIGGIEKNKKEEFINSLKSKYVQNSLKSGHDPGISTYWRFPSSKPYIWEGTIDWKWFLGNQEVISGVWKDSEQLGISYFMQYTALQAVVPIVYQLSEEHYFVSSSLSFFINYYLEIIAQELVNKKVIGEKEEIYDMELSELNQKIREVPL